MKVHVLLFASSVLMISLFSCTSTRPIMDDNVYVMQTPDLPLGKDLLDETSYDTYKYRVNAGAQTNGYYDQRNRSLINSGPVITLGSNWFAYGRWNNYGTLPYMSSAYWGAHRNGFYAMDGIPGVGYSPYSPYGYYGGSSMYNNPYYFSSAWYEPSYYYSPYGGFYNNGMPPGQYYTNGYYGFSGNLNNQNNNAQVFNAGSGYYVSGPRATSGGYYSGSSRGGTQQLKAPSSTGSSSSNLKSTAYSARNSSNSAPKYSRTTPVSQRTVRTSPQRQTNSSARNASTSRSTSGSRTSGAIRTTSSPSRSTGVSSSGSRSTGSSRSSGSSSSGSSSSGRSGGRGM